jgi:hypothetical protein
MHVFLLLYAQYSVPWRTLDGDDAGFSALSHERNRVFPWRYRAWPYCLSMCRRGAKSRSFDKGLQPITCIRHEKVHCSFLFTNRVWIQLEKRDSTCSCPRVHNYFFHRSLHDLFASSSHTISSIDPDYWAIVSTRKCFKPFFTKLNYHIK